MTKQKILKLLMLLSALESWSFSTNSRLPDHLYEDIQSAVDSLSALILDEGVE